MNLIDVPPAFVRETGRPIDTYGDGEGFTRFIPEFDVHLEMVRPVELHGIVILSLCKAVRFDDGYWP